MLSHRAEPALLGYLSHYLDAGRDVTWSLDRLAERDARGAELAGLRRIDWPFSLP